MRQPCGYCGNRHPPRQYPAYGKTCAGCHKIGHFKAVCKSRKAREVNEIEQIENQDEAEEDTEMVSIDSIQFNKNSSVLTANLKMAAGNNKIMVVYKIDRVSNGNIMPFHVYKNYLLTLQKNSWPKLEIKE